jgi:hypothetical protein
VGRYNNTPVNEVMTSYLRVAWIIVQWMAINENNPWSEDDLFDQLVRDHVKPPSYADKIVEDIEADFTDMSTANREREKEKKTLQDRLVALKARLNKTKNIKNPSKAALNTEQAKKRAAIKKEIEEIKDKLANIEAEEQGQDITSEKLLNSQ